MARLWAMVYALCDDLDNPEEQLDLARMPAHTSWADVGRARLSDGSLLTERDRFANDRADDLAKTAARTHRVPALVRKQIALRADLAEWAARSLAVATQVANCARVTGSKRLARDATGGPKPKRRSSARPTAGTRRTVAAGATLQADAVQRAVVARDSDSSGQEGGCGAQDSRKAGRRRPPQRKYPPRGRASSAPSPHARPDLPEAVLQERVRHLCSATQRPAAQEKPALPCVGPVTPTPCGQATGSKGKATHEQNRDPRGGQPTGRTSSARAASVPPLPATGRDSAAGCAVGARPHGSDHASWRMRSPPRATIRAAPHAAKPTIRSRPGDGPAACSVAAALQRLISGRR